MLPRRFERSLVRVFPLALFVLLLLIIPSVALADTIYVDKDATGAATGISWTDAYTNVQDALNQAAYGDEIWVAKGLYIPGTGRTDTFMLEPGVALYGGFDGTETERAQRDWAAHVTVLSGDINGDDTTDDNGVVTNPSNISGNNAYHVVSGQGVTETAVLDGFTITAGNANSNDVSGMRGGGMYNYGNSSPTLTNLTFSGNDGIYGGGMYNYNSSSPTLTNCAFRGNSATSGGGMINNESSSPTLINVVFSGNQIQPTSHAGGGGGMYNYDSSSPTLINCTFSGNATQEVGGAMWNRGTGEGAGSNPTLKNCILWGNMAEDEGPEIYNDEYSEPTISYSDIEGSGGSDSWDSGLGADGGNNIDADPVFVAAITATEAPTTAGDYRLQAGSPSIDAGDNGAITVTIDLDGNPRKVDGDGDGDAVVDMGAYEVQQNPSLTLTKTVTPTTGVSYHGTVTYTVNLSNTGSGDDTNVLFTDTLPAKVDFASWIEQSGASVDSDEITWSGTVTAGETITWTWTATHTGDYGDVVTNTAEFSGTLQAGTDEVTLTVEAAPPRPVGGMSVPGAPLRALLPWAALAVLAALLAAGGAVRYVRR